MDKAYVDAIVAGGQVYPGAGIALSTGSAWDTPITNNSANWNTAYGWGDPAVFISTHESTYNHIQYNTAYTHSQLGSGNPHSVSWAELSGARSGITLSGFDDDLSYNNYTHPNHSGQVTSVGEGATVATAAIITAQTELASGLVDADELMVSDAGVLKKMDISVLEAYMQANLTFSSGMIYPGAGIALSTGSAWGTSITNNSANWNTAYGWGDHAGLYDTLGTAAGLVSTHESTYNHGNYNTAYSHSQIVTGNPHVIGHGDISDFGVGVSSNETSHADVLVDGDFVSEGIMLRGASSGVYSIVGASYNVDTVETTLTDDDTHLPTSGAVYGAISAAGGMVYPGTGIAISTGSAWDTSITNNSANWNTAYGWGDHAG